MKKVILIFVLAAFAMIAVGQEPLFKKSITPKPKKKAPQTSSYMREI